MPDPSALLDHLNKRSRALLERVEKELARAEPKNASAGTVLVGGWTKMGAEIEGFLDAVFGWLCARERRNPPDELRSAFPQLNPDKATTGHVVGVIKELSNLPSAKANEVSLICRDLAAYPSRLRQLIEMRNKVVHERDALPPYSAAKATLEPVAQLLRSYRKQAGF